MTMERQTMATRARGWGAQLLQFLAALGLVFLAKGAIAEPFYVPSGSMEPTLLIGDALLASKFPYGYGSASLPIQINLPETGRIFANAPKRGDVVVFRWPGDRSQAWVKRVVGLPGDRIQMRQGQLFINDRAASLKPDGLGEVEDERGGYEPARRYIETLPGGVSHAIFKIRDNGRLDNTAEVTVPEGLLFVMGDNRDNSADSRVPLRDGGVGMLPIDDLVGRADAVIGSWDLGIREQPVWTWLSGFRLARFFTSVRLTARSLAVLLDRRTRHRSVRTEHAAIAGLRLEFLAAPLADIEELARIERHGLGGLKAAFRARQRRFRLHIVYRSTG